MVDHTTTVGRIASLAGGSVTCGDPAAVIETVTTDSRELGKNNLFIPLIGEKYDGHSFIAPLSESGSIRSYLTMREGYTDIAMKNEVSEIRCSDTLAALSSIASRHRDLMNAKVVGITGSNGKTTTKELVYAVLNTQKKCLKNQKNYNNEIGVPMTLLGLQIQHDIAVIEMGMNHAGEIDRLSRIVKPDIALITNVGEGHLGFLGSMENVARAKSEIMHGMSDGSLLLANRETNCLDVIVREASLRGLTVKTYGLSADADIRPASYRLSGGRTAVLYKGVEIAVPLYGIHNVYNIVAAIAVAGEFGVEPEAIQKALAGFEGMDGRSQIIDRGYVVINDSYNSNPLSLEYALRSAREIFPGRRKIAVLSDMKELGDFTKACHIECGRAVARNGFDMLLLWGDCAHYYSEGAESAGFGSKNIILFNTKDELSRYLAKIADQNDVILIKGSRSMKMEDVVNAITEGVD
jgi:UDP-N-acetylmuramoyl-tripeptide--D-alanyl-D-alanine ligase